MHWDTLSFSRLAGKVAAPWKTGVGFASHLRFNKAKQSSAVTYARNSSEETGSSKQSMDQDSVARVQHCVTMHSFRIWRPLRNRKRSPRHDGPFGAKVREGGEKESKSMMRAVLLVCT